jgi:hypothetical protein
MDVTKIIKDSQATVEKWKATQKEIFRQIEQALCEFPSVKRLGDNQQCAVTFYTTLKIATTVRAADRTEYCMEAYNIKHSGSNRPPIAIISVTERKTEKPVIVKTEHAPEQQCRTAEEAIRIVATELAYLGLLKPQV